MLDGLLRAVRQKSEIVHSGKHPGLALAGLIMMRTLFNLCDLHHDQGFDTTEPLPQLYYSMGGILKINWSVNESLQKLTVSAPLVVPCILFLTSARF